MNIFDDQEIEHIFTQLKARISSVILNKNNIFFMSHFFIRQKISCFLKKDKTLIKEMIKNAKKDQFKLINALFFFELVSFEIIESDPILKDLVIFSYLLENKNDLVIGLSALKNLKKFNQSIDKLPNFDPERKINDLNFFKKLNRDPDFNEIQFVYENLIHLIRYNTNYKEIKEQIKELEYKLFMKYVNTIKDHLINIKFNKQTYISYNKIINDYQNYITFNDSQFFNPESDKDLNFLIKDSVKLGILSHKEMNIPVYYIKDSISLYVKEYLNFNTNPFLLIENNNISFYLVALHTIICQQNTFFENNKLLDLFLNEQMKYNPFLSLLVRLYDSRHYFSQDLIRFLIKSIKDKKLDFPMSFTKNIQLNSDKTFNINCDQQFQCDIQLILSISLKTLFNEQYIKLLQSNKFNVSLKSNYLKEDQFKAIIDHFKRESIKKYNKKLEEEQCKNKREKFINNFVQCL